MPAERRTGGALWETGVGGWTVRPGATFWVQGFVNCFLLSSHLFHGRERHDNWWLGRDGGDGLRWWCDAVGCVVDGWASFHFCSLVRFGEGMAGVFGDDCKGGSLRVLVCGGEMKTLGSRERAVAMEMVMAKWWFV
ncbi:hypothetical protein M0R45_014084 [Rubus argutus]|uniref:Uncharacterized protein n=1 Tax=Rubus argutus TaxID=59490 RepID=A0AAW1XKF5_RUBAR